MYISRRVNNLCRKYKTNCPYTISDHLNLNVRFMDMPDYIKGHYQRVLRRRYIVINNNLSDEWKRFVCAHELGHDRLHKGTSHHFIKTHTFYNPSTYERQANKFAVLLLLNGIDVEEGETLQSYFLKNSVPIEMAKYF